MDGSGAAAPSRRPLYRRWEFWGALAVAAGIAVAFLLQPSRDDEFRQLYEDTAAVFVERGDDLPPFFDPEFMTVDFAWDGDRAEVHADNVERRHAEYDPNYEAYRICEWAHSWVLEQGSPETDLAIYVDGQVEMVVHETEDCLTADAD